MIAERLIGLNRDWEQVGRKTCKYLSGRAVRRGPQVPASRICAKAMLASYGLWRGCDESRLTALLDTTFPVLSAKKNW
jgi:hypothetical protein